jgi:hypothetical protein
MFRCARPYDLDPLAYHHRGRGRRGHRRALVTDPPRSRAGLWLLGLAGLVAGFVAVTASGVAARTARTVMGATGPAAGSQPERTGTVLVLVLAAVVVVLLLVHAADGRLRRALAEYAIVAALAVALAGGALPGGVDLPRPQVPGPVAATVDGGAKVARGIGGAWDWLRDLWDQAGREYQRDAKPNQPGRGAAK